MKTKNILLIITGLFIIVSGVSAEYRIYNNVEDFEAAKGSICEAATDGCNNYFMVDGKVGGGTRMACGENFVAEWNCTKFKENSITTMSLPMTTSVEVTTTSNKLSTNDQSFYDTIKKRLDNKYQVAVDGVIAKYLDKTKDFSSLKKIRVNDRFVKLLGQKISLLLMQYPQDIALPERVNNIYLTLKLFQFELMKLDF